ncbi:MAG: hypothetical protein IKW81_07395 [Pseudobutyrivibrio sp.]|nr:hypothetical protein [Pseudobutyrivibrio sp.]
MDESYEYLKEAIKSYQCPSCGQRGRWTNTCELAVDGTGIYAECTGRINGQECYYILTASSLEDLMQTDANFRAFTNNLNQQKAPWEASYYNHPCPYCGQYKVRDAKWGDKAISTAFWGFLSHKLHSRYKCDACGNMWD